MKNTIKEGELILTEEEIELVENFRREKKEAAEKALKLKEGIQKMLEGWKLINEGGGSVEIDDDEYCSYDDVLDIVARADGKGIIIYY